MNNDLHREIRTLKTISVIQGLAVIILGLAVILK